MAKREKEQPGVMIYFGDYDCVAELPDDKLGLLLRAVIEYAKTGAEIHNFGGDQAMNVAWNFFRSKVELDFARYAKKKEARIYANKCKFIKYHPELGLDANNPEDVDRITQDAKGRFIVLEEPARSLSASLSYLAKRSSKTEAEAREEVRRALLDQNEG